MKKIYPLLSLMLITTMLFSQEKISPSLIQYQMEQIPTSNFDSPEYNMIKSKSNTNKVFGDTLASFDFNGGIPSGWTVVNNNGGVNNFQWQWDTVAINGQFTTGLGAIGSTTASNGFMILPSDFYNTPFPPTGPVDMDTYFESDSINIPVQNSVWISYQQFLIYCCRDASLAGPVRLVLQVSTDNFNTFEEYLANDGLPSNANTAAGNVSNNVINISTAVAGATSFKIRFLAEGNTSYIWYIDDIAIIEGAKFDLQMEDELLEFYTDGHVFNPFYGQVPYALFPPLPFSADLYNNGSDIATRARIEVDVTHTGGPAPATGLVYSTASPDTTLPFDSAIFALTAQPRFVPQILGDFQVDFSATMDSVDQDLNNNSGTLTFGISDTAFIKDDDGYGGGTGSGSYVRAGLPGGTAIGDAYGTKYVFEPNRVTNNVQRTPTSVTFGVSRNVDNIGVEIIPKIWEFFEDSLFSPTVTTLDQAVGAVVATTFIPYTVTALDTGQLLTLAFDSTISNPLDSGMQYIVGFEVTSITGGTNFEVFNDFTSSVLQPAFNTFLNFGHSPGWGTTGDNPVIRLNMGNLPLSTNLQKNDLLDVRLSLTPNPSAGLLTMNITDLPSGSYQLEAINATGQLVHTELLSVNGQLQKQLDFSHLEKGIYFVKLANGSQNITKKVILR